MLFTTSFPYGIGEQFLETEIIFLSKAFEKIFILPTLTATGTCRQLPSNCQIITPIEKFKPSNKVRPYIIKNFRKVVGIYVYTLIKSKQKQLYTKNIKATLIQLSIEIEKAKYYYRYLNPFLAQTNTLYFYWFQEPIFQYVILKSNSTISHKIITRAHGYDYDFLQGKIAYFREKLIK